MEPHWGWLIAIYLFLGGLGAGTFLIAAAFDLTGKRYQVDFCVVTLVGAVVSGPAVAVGAALLILDLGAGLMEPWRILYLFSLRNFDSVMMWGVWILTLFIPVALLYGVLEILDAYPSLREWFKSRRWLRWLRFLHRVPVRPTKRVVILIGSVFAVATALYTGVLISAMGPAVPFWSTSLLPFVNVPMMPILFLVSAVSTGIGLTVDLVATMSVPNVVHRLPAMTWIHLVFIGLETLLLGLLLITAFVNGGVAAQAAQDIVVGPHSIVFWVLIVIPGFVYPFIVHVYAMGIGGHSVWTGLLSGVGIVTAGLFLRYLILIAGLPAAL